MPENERNQIRTVAHVVPFLVFMLFLAVPDILSLVLGDETEENAAWYLAEPRLWLYPLQTVTCLFLLVALRQQYDFGPHRGWAAATLAGILGIAVWIAPGYLFRTLQVSPGWWRHFGFAPRTEGFDPTMLQTFAPVWYLPVMAFRFLRLVIVVPFVEEIFWRGFLMRYVTDPDGDFWQVPFGAFHRRSLVVVTAMFVLVHAPVDYATASVFGLLMYGIAVRTKSLSACILMHAVANLLLGLYVMATGQWGYW